VVVALLVALAFVGLASGQIELAGVSLPPSEQESTLFKDIAVFDGDRLLPHRDVLISGSTIRGVASTGQLDVPAGARVVEGSGLTLLPGLVDSHVHLFSAGEKGGMPPAAESIGEAFLYSGVTTVLVAAGGSEVTKLRERRAAGEVLAPHLYASGPGLTAPGGHPIPLLRAMLPWPLSALMLANVVTAANGDEAKARVQEIDAEHSPEFLKITYDDLPPGSPHLSSESLIAAIAEAERLDIRPIVHTTTPEDTLEAAEAGAALLMHIPQRAVLSDADVQRLRATGVPFATTIRLISASHDLAQRGPTQLEKASVDSEQLARWQAEPAWDLEGFSEEVDRRHAEIATITEDNFRKLHAAGVALFVGTDSGVHGVFPGSSIHSELQLLVLLGMPPIEALRAATSRPADFLDPGHSFGRIGEGQRADLLVVRGDPTTDIAALASIEAVYLDGRRLGRHALNEAD